MSKNKPNGYWNNLEHCKVSALKYNTRIEWKKKNHTGYRSACRNDWLEECCGHMIRVSKPCGYWNFKRCKASALKFSSRTEWQKTNHGAYGSAWRNGWLEECCGHMEIKGHKYKRMVYAFYVGKEVYIGLTWNLDDRKSRHKLYGKQYTYLVEKYGEKKIIWVGLSDFLLVEEAQKKEKSCIEYFKSKGCKVLNIAKAGSLGGSTLIWNLKKCKASALKFSSRSEWSRNERGAYSSAMRYGWLDLCCGHMKTTIRKPKNYWTLERCIEDALNYNSRSEWARNSIAYQKARKNGWFEECCGHMVELCKPNGYWNNLERCIEEAKKYSSIAKWQRNNSSSYVSSRSHGWLDLCCGHMKSIESKSKFYKYRDIILVGLRSGKSVRSIALKDLGLTTYIGVSKHIKKYYDKELQEWKNERICGYYKNY